MTDKEVKRLEIIKSIEDIETEIATGVKTKDYNLLFVKIKNDLDKLLPTVKKNYEAAFFADDAAKAVKEADEAVVAAADKAKDADDEAIKSAATPEIIQAAKDANLAVDSIKVFAKDARLAADKALNAVKKAASATTEPDVATATKEAEDAAKEARQQADLAQGKKPAPSAAASASGGFPVPPGGRGGPPVPRGGRGGPPVPRGGRGGPPVPKTSGAAPTSPPEPVIPHDLHTEIGKVSDGLKNLRLALDAKDEENIPKIFQQVEKELNDNLKIPTSGVKNKAWTENVDTLPFLLKKRYGDELKNLYDKLNTDITDAISKKEYHKVQPTYEKYLKDIEEIKVKLIKDLTVTTTKNNTSIAKTFFSSDVKDDAFRANFSSLIDGTPISKFESLIQAKSIEFAAQDKEGKEEKTEAALDFTNSLSENKATLDQKVEIIHKLLPKVSPSDIEKATDLTMLLSKHTPPPVISIQTKIKLKTHLASMHTTQTAIKEDESKLAKAIPSAESKKSLLIKPDGSIDLLKLLQGDKALIKLWNTEKENKIKRDAGGPSIPKSVKAAVVLAPITIPKSAVALEAGTLFTSVLSDHFLNLTSSNMTDREYSINGNLEIFFERSEADQHISTPETLLADTNFLLEAQKGAVSKPGIPNIFMLAIASGYIEKKPFSVFNRSVKDFVLTSPKSTDELVGFFANEASPSYSSLKKLADSSPTVLSPALEAVLKESFDSSVDYHKKDKWIQSVLSDMGKTTVIAADKLKNMQKSWTPEMSSYISTLVETDGSLNASTLSQEQKDLLIAHKTVLSAKLEPVLAKLDPATMTNLEDFEALNSLQNGNVQISDNPDTLNLFHQLATEVSKQLVGVTPPTKDELKADLASLLGEYSKKHFQNEFVAQVPDKQSIPVFSEEAIIRKRINLAREEADKAVAEAEMSEAEANLMASGPAPTPEAGKKAAEAAKKTEEEAEKARIAAKTAQSTKDPDAAENAMKEAQDASKEAKKHASIVEGLMVIKSSAPSKKAGSATAAPSGSLSSAAIGPPSLTFMSSSKSSSISTTGIAADGSVKGSLEQETKLKAANEKIKTAKEQKAQQERLIESYQRSQSASPIAFAQTGGITKLQTAIKALNKAETEISEAEIEALAIRISIVEKSHTGEAKSVLAEASESLTKQNNEIQSLKAQSKRLENIQGLAKKTIDSIKAGTKIIDAISSMAKECHHEDWLDVQKEFLAQSSIAENGFKTGQQVTMKQCFKNVSPNPIESGSKLRL